MYNLTASLYWLWSHHVYCSLYLISGKKKTGVMSPWNRTKNILHRDWLLNSHSESRGRPNAIKEAYFESIFFWFDQKTKYVVPIYQLSN